MSELTRVRTQTFIPRSAFDEVSTMNFFTVASRSILDKEFFSLSFFFRDNVDSNFALANFRRVDFLVALNDIHIF